MPYPADAARTRPSQYPQSNMNGPWFKIVGFILLVMMLAGVVQMLIDPGFGSATDESRRFTHPAGFSIVAPRGWDSSISLEKSGRTVESLRIASPVGVGFNTSITVTRLPAGEQSRADTSDRAVSLTFQGKPARALTEQLRNRWRWTLSFHRPEADGGHYELVYLSPTIPDVETGPIRAFLESFRPSTLPATRPASASVSATAPATAPVAVR